MKFKLIKKDDVSLEDKRKNVKFKDIRNFVK